MRINLTFKQSSIACFELREQKKYPKFVFLLKPLQKYFLFRINVCIGGPIKERMQVEHIISIKSFMSTFKAFMNKATND